LMAQAAAAGLLRSAHDPSDGGLAVALAECCFVGEAPGLGARVTLPAGLRDDVALFSESPSRMLVSAPAAEPLEALAAQHGVPCARLGKVGGERLSVSIEGRGVLDVAVSELHAAWMSLEARLQVPATR